MSAPRKGGNAGWFYHAPTKRQNKEPVLVGPASQIPGLNNAEDLSPDEPVKPLFRQTDTKYIRLCKEGGRHDLLQFRDQSNKKTKEPKPYPRTEWYYLEDQAYADKMAREDEEEPKPHQFMVPEYMVHEAYKGDPSYDQQVASQGSYRPQRLPYAKDTTSVYERDGDHVKDKTVKLPEIRKTGYGVRSGKPLKMKSQPPPPDKANPQSAPSDPTRAAKLKYLPVPAEDKTEATKMTKLLAFTYDKEWHEEHEKWEKKQAKLRKKAQLAMKSEEEEDLGPITTEYRDTIGKEIPQNKPRRVRKTWESTQAEKDLQAAKTIKLTKSEEKELFKLSRFKNIGHRIDSHWPKEVPAH